MFHYMSRWTSRWGLKPAIIIIISSKTQPPPAGWRILSVDGVARCNTSEAQSFLVSHTSGILWETLYHFVYCYSAGKMVVASSRDIVTISIEDLNLNWRASWSSWWKDRIASYILEAEIKDVSLSTWFEKLSQIIILCWWEDRLAVSLSRSVISGPTPPDCSFEAFVGLLLPVRQSQYTKLIAPAYNIIEIK